ncbi:MAG TPA: hypothetical protein VL860_14305 [Planctomycetota bacterium]|jgi:hypothetical protein|nr:hypothetical protein [Planctomycetota bacterium]
MKILRIVFASLLCTAGLFLAGCHGDVLVEEDVAYEPYYDDEIIVRDAPPAPIIEVISECPGPDYIWIGGWWYWSDRWVWRRGYWGRRPYSGSVWVHPYWSHERGGWRQHSGHWRH